MEIHQGAVVAVQLRQGRRGPVLGGYATEPLPPDAVTPSGVAKPAVLRQAVENALQNAKAGRVNLCLAFAVDSMDARELRLPPMPEADTKAAIQFELRQFFGGAAGGDDDRLLDFEFIQDLDRRDNHRPDDNVRNLLVVSVPRRKVYEYVTPLHEAKIYPEIVDVGIFSLPFAVPRGGGVAYLHLGPGLTNFLVMQNGVYELSRQTELQLQLVLDNPHVVLATRAQAEAAPVPGGYGAGGAAPAGAAGAGYGTAETGYGAAETGYGQAASGLDEAAAASETAAPEPAAAGGAVALADTPAGRVLEQLMNWVSETLEFARVRRGAFTVEEAVQSIVISGPAAAVPGIAPLIEQRVGIQTSPAMPVIGDGSTSLPEDAAPVYALAVAMAHRGLTEL